MRHHVGKFGCLFRYFIGIKKPFKLHFSSFLPGNNFVTSYFFFLTSRKPYSFDHVNPDQAVQGRKEGLKSRHKRSFHTDLNMNYWHRRHCEMLIKLLLLAFLFIFYLAMVTAWSVYSAVCQVQQRQITEITEKLKRKMLSWVLRAYFSC